MAKRGRPRAANPNTAEQELLDAQQGRDLGAARPTSNVEAFAEDLGRILGTARAKAEGWLGQRQAVAKQLTQIRDTANELLSQLTDGGARMAAAVTAARRGRPPGSGRKRGPGRPKGSGQKRTLSAKARAAISRAQKARWANVRKEKGE